APQLEKAGWAYETIGHLEPVAAHERQAAEPGPIDAGAEKAGRALLDKALAAKGGAARLGALKSLTITGKGKIALGPQVLPATMMRRYVAPDKLRLDIQISVGGMNAEVITVLASDKAWNKQPQTGTVELPAEAVAELQKQIWRDQEFILVRHKDAGVKVA